MADALNLRFSVAPWQMHQLYQSPIRQFNGITSSGLKFGWVFMAQDANAITHLGFHVSDRTGTPPAYKLSLQGVDASNGYPNGTVKGGASPASVVFTPPADSSWNFTFQWKSLDNSYTPTKGELLAMVLEYSSGTATSGNCMYLSNWLGLLGVTNFCIPYILDYNGSAWSKTRSDAPVFGVRSTSTRYGFPIHGAMYNSTGVSTVGNRQALKFNIPAGWFNSFTVKGVRFSGQIASSSGKAPVVGLWNAGGVLQNVTLDSDVSYAPTNQLNTHEVYFDETTLSTLSTGTDYYLGVEVADASSAVILGAYVVSETDDNLCFPLGTSACFSTYNGSAWSDTTTKRPCVELILGDITGGGGGSSGLMFRRTFDGGLA